MTTTTSRSRYALTRRDAWRDALAGDHVGAYRRFRTAAALAPSDAWRVLALADRAALARELGELLTAADAIGEAEELADRIDWNATSSDERCGLLLLAVLLAPQTPAWAQARLDTFNSIATKGDADAAAPSNDKHQRAAEAYAFGATAAACGRASEAIPLLGEAFELYRERRYDWRAVAVALDLHELNGDAALLAFARKRALRVPHSWLARRVAKTEARDRC